MSKKLKIRVLHAYYGCDTGCCGHIVEVEDAETGKDLTRGSTFEFSHPYDEDFKQWAIEFAQEYIKREHPQCFDSIDWDTVEYKDVSSD